MELVPVSPVGVEQIVEHPHGTGARTRVYKSGHYTREVGTYFLNFLMILPLPSEVYTTTLRLPFS